MFVWEDILFYGKFSEQEKGMIFAFIKWNCLQLYSKCLPRGCLPDKYSKFLKLFFFRISWLWDSIVFRDTEVDTFQLYGVTFQEFGGIFFSS